ncbi:MAG TPA: arginine--tRNA ligase [Candidatus Sulfotelmatobacter sp.]|nr:arginine--tRNA ligase [Candidatus Sulfotelmatobacter sp.]
MERLKQRLSEELAVALAAVAARQGWPQTTMPELAWSYPPSPRFGDLATPVAFTLAQQLRKKPREIATAIQEVLRPDPDVLSRIEVAGAGYLNFFIAPGWWQAVVREVLAAGSSYGRAEIGRGERVQVEFVSANPTGPLHVGHGRGAVLGDAVASLLQATGYAVEREYYINDAGTQVRLLGESVWARLQEAAGRSVEFPADGYHGEYIRELATQVAKTNSGLEALPRDEAVAACAREGSRILLDEIRADLARFGITFDVWFSERSLFESGQVEAVLAALKAGGYLYEEQGAVGFRASEFGDEKDRILIRGSGEPTYFTSDIAYHANKIRRGFRRLINIWGADHGGYIPRVRAAIHALGQDPEILHVILLQMVRVLRGGLPVPMSKRTGQFVELREVLDEVGRDAARFLFLTRRPESQLDFDIEVAKRQTLDNPVYYVQYAHARACSVARRAEEAGIPGPYDGADLDCLTLPEELDMMKRLALYPEMLQMAALAYEPHRVTTYLQELAAAFHGYFTRYKDSDERVISADKDLSRARLAMVAGVRQVVANALGLLGVTAPERM